MTDRFEDLSQSEFGNQQPKRAPALPLLGQYVRACSRSSRNQAHALQVVHGFGNGDARRVEQLAQFCFAGKSVSRLQLTRLNAGKKVFEDTAMLRQVNRRVTLWWRAKLTRQSS